MLEDDPYGLVRYEGEAPPTIFELEGGTNVVYASSFSKTIAPGVRVGYFVLPPALAAQIEALAVVDVHLAAVPHAGDGPRVRPARATSSRTSSASAACSGRAATRCSRRSSSTCPTGATWSRPEGGYFIWLDFPPAPTRASCSRAREAAGVTFVKGTDFFADGSGTRSLRLAFSFVSLDEIAEGVSRLAAATARRAGAGVGALAATAGSRRRSPTARLSRISQIERDVRGREDEVQRARLAVLEHERDRVRGEQRRARPCAP